VTSLSKKSGRPALVLPATVLRVDSMKGVRKLLLDNYHIQYINSSFQRSAFSEAARFREVLIVGSKLSDMKDTPADVKKQGLFGLSEIGVRVRMSILSHPIK
jgi:hypothetical protein